MNQQRYRQAVRSICWSPQQRAAIEEKLRAAPIASDDPDLWIDGLEDPMAAYRQSQEAMRKSEEYNMNAKKMRKIMWIGLAAAILATGGTVAAIAYAKKHPRTLEIKWKNGTELNLTGEEVPSLYMTNHYVNPQLNLEDIVPTGNGWYYRKRVTLMNKTNQWGGLAEELMLCYTDRETGQTVPVCAKPNCLHEADEYCTATTINYAPSYMKYYDGYLYTMTTKYLKPDARSSQCNLEGPETSPDNCRQVLLRYAPDGTEIKELADFGGGIGAASCTVNRGYVWCLVQLQQAGEEVENPITHMTQTFQSGGWQIWGYELATGKSVLVYDAMGDPSVNHANTAPNDIYAFGDYLYFVRSAKDWSGGQGLARLSLLTGEVTDDKEEILITGDHCTCLSATHAIRSKQHGGGNDYTYDFYILDLQTLEEKKLSPDLDKVPEDEPALGRDYYITFMNDRYIFARNYDNFIGSHVLPAKIGIYDYDGNLVKLVDTGYQIESWQESIKTEDGYNGGFLRYNEWFTPVAIDGDTVYATHILSGDPETLKKRGKKEVNDVIYTTVDDLLSGTPHWQKAYSLTEEVHGDAQ